MVASAQQEIRPKLLDPRYNCISRFQSNISVSQLHFLITFQILEVSKINNFRHVSGIDQISDFTANISL